MTESKLIIIITLKCLSNNLKCKTKRNYEEISTNRMLKYDKNIHEWWIKSDNQMIRGAISIFRKHRIYIYIVMNKF